MRKSLLFVGSEFSISKYEEAEALENLIQKHSYESILPVGLRLHQYCRPGKLVWQNTIPTSTNRTSTALLMYAI